jgi:hypothetical protein
MLEKRKKEIEGGGGEKREGGRGGREREKKREGKREKLNKKISDFTILPSRYLPWR